MNKEKIVKCILFAIPFWAIITLVIYLSAGKPNLILNIAVTLVATLYYYLVNFELLNKEGNKKKGGTNNDKK